MTTKILAQKIPTNEEGIFYKRIINENNKEVDKVFIRRCRENFKDKLQTIGKYAQGIITNNKTTKFLSILSC